MEPKIDEYDHRIVATETADCKCGGTHDEGDVLFGSKVPLDRLEEEMRGGPMETVESLHSVEAEVA
jgi:hypothetical protein